ncbi:hypothetical protein CUMW_013990 [Citrus unshiu]|nr:hypothetical protein CUMW_013990 [Citrus unshiu]
MNQAIERGFAIGPAQFSPVYFPMGNAATGSFLHIYLPKHMQPHHLSLERPPWFASVMDGLDHLIPNA